MAQTIERISIEQVPSDGEIVLEAIKRMQAFLERVPPQYRETATIDIDRDDMFGDTFTICYWRPETEEEIRQREASIRASHMEEVRRLESNLAAARRRAGLE